MSSGALAGKLHKTGARYNVRERQIFLLIKKIKIHIKPQCRYSCCSPVSFMYESLTATPVWRERRIWYTLAL